MSTQILDPKVDVVQTPPIEEVSATGTHTLTVMSGAALKRVRINESVTGKAFRKWCAETFGWTKLHGMAMAINTDGQIATVDQSDVDRHQIAADVKGKARTIEWKKPVRAKG